MNVLYSRANNIAPIDPTAEDSVGVAIPAKIEPKTKMISASEGIISIRAFCTCLALLPREASAGIAGATSFLR